MNTEPTSDTENFTVTGNVAVETVPVEPVKTFERDENGYVKGLVYPHRLSDNRIDWVKLIDPKHIIFNPYSGSAMQKAILEKYGKPANELVYADLLATGVEIDPKHILVLLMGMTELADLRGYYSATPRIVCSSKEICACECTIEWLPNSEEPEGKISFGTADATMENTNNWGYLAAMAGNRAFVRAVRQGLRIPILGFDEIAKKDMAIPESQSTTGSEDKLHTYTLRMAAEKHVDENGQSAPLSFEQVKIAAGGKYKEKMESNPVDWKKWGDIPPKDSLTLIKLIKAKEKGK